MIVMTCATCDKTVHIPFKWWAFCWWFKHAVIKMHEVYFKLW